MKEVQYLFHRLPMLVFGEPEQFVSNLRFNQFTSDYIVSCRRQVKLITIRIESSSVQLLKYNVVAVFVPLIIRLIYDLIFTSFSGLD